MHVNYFLCMSAHPANENDCSIKIPFTTVYSSICVKFRSLVSIWFLYHHKNFRIFILDKVLLFT